MNLADDEILFADEPDDTKGDGESDVAPWKILIVDDEEEIHRVTELSLQGVVVHGRPLSFLHAYTGVGSVEIMRTEPDIALVLMDVVMEYEHAGLEAVERIREELGNHDVRLVLRTGQPGQAPERDVVTRYDINDYKEKTELTSKKMHTLVHTSLGHYRELIALKQNRQGLEKVIEASASIFESPSILQFARGVLTQLAALLYASNDAVMVRGITAGMRKVGDDTIVVTASSSGDQTIEGKPINEVLPELAVERIRKSLDYSEPYFGKGYFTAHFATRSGAQHVVYITSDAEFSIADRRLVELFCRNVGIAFENQVMHQEVLDSQHKLVLLLSAVVEERSKELRNHVRRVSEYAAIIGEKLGLDNKELELLQLSAALHDIGKIGIPDEILNKPGRHNDVERAIMQTHVERGETILGSQTGALLKTAGVVVGTHHERWDGKGYPRQLSGEEIPLYGRITAIADVFDALSTRRVYKEPWPMDEVIAYFREQRGVQFDPNLVDLFLESMDAVQDIYEKFHA